MLILFQAFQPVVLLILQDLSSQPPVLQKALCFQLAAQHFLPPPAQSLPQLYPAVHPSLLQIQIAAHFPPVAQPAPALPVPVAELLRLVALLPLANPVPDSQAYSVPAISDKTGFSS